MTDDVVWDCVTCGACVQACPVSIEHIDHIVDLRRHLVMVEARFPAEADPMLRDVERSSNPWGKAQSERAAWAEGLGVRVLEPGDPAPEVLYWVGCAASFDERAKTSAESTAKLLQAAGVDFAILGPREACTGDPARRMGNEYVFQAFAEQNVETLNETGAGKIVTSCPHCFNTLANEYPDFGGSYEVVHHSELLAELVREGRITPGGGEKAITYHDSCYLARHNDVAAEPRELVAAVGTPVEMERTGKQTFCCGAGGAHMWMEERGRGSTRSASARPPRPAPTRWRSPAPTARSCWTTAFAPRAATCAWPTWRRCSPSRSTTCRSRRTPVVRATTGSDPDVARYPASQNAGEYELWGTVEGACSPHGPARPRNGPGPGCSTCRSRGT